MMDARISARSCAGDAIVHVGEECDDGNALDSDACLTSCVTARCGDGVVQIGVELCDEAAQNTDTCSYGEMSCSVCSTQCQTQNVTAFVEMESCRLVMASCVMMVATDVV